MARLTMTRIDAPVKRTPPARADPRLPPASDWRTTDEDERARRRLRAREEGPRIERVDRSHPVFSTFRVHSRSGLDYAVEIRDVAARQFACGCVDFRINGLDTCKHVEAVLAQLEAVHPRDWRAALRAGSPRVDVVPDREAGRLRVERNADRAPARLRRLLAADGGIDLAPEEALETIAREFAGAVRVSQEVAPWLETRRRERERVQLRREYEQKVQSGEWPAQEVKVPLFPYQREGMLHLAFAERALLADEMGLGKTIQAIAACALLRRVGRATRALVVTPASLKAEWEEQIRRFTDLDLQIVYGARRMRLAAYQRAPFFTIVNYEQMVSDTLDVNARLRPDIVVLDEAQRIKNWSTKTAQAVKRLHSRYAFVLTGTPIENRIDELWSIVDFLDPARLGPLFRFNREFYELDERGRPEGYRNLARLRSRIAPLMRRRRKADVESELPERTDRQFFVEMTPEQRASYESHEAVVARLAAIAKRRALTQKEQERLLKELNIMRMLCDTPYILDPGDRTCPKRAELEKILDECCGDPEVKVLVFSEWEGMLDLARETCRKLGLGFAWHTGRVPQRRRRAEILAFKTDPRCRVFLSTDSGGVGLNLQNASYVINCDLPWNPARLEQRIARAWRKHQTRPVTVINLVTAHSIEAGMLVTLEAKQGLAAGVLDGAGDLDRVVLRRGKTAFLERLQQTLAASGTPTASPALPRRPADAAQAFAEACMHRLDGALAAFEERFVDGREDPVLFVVTEQEDSGIAERIRALHRELDLQHPLQIVSRATAETLDQLAASGMITLNVRARRVLHPPADRATPQRLLSPADRERREALKAQALRRLRAARLLADNGLAEEAGQPLRDALHAALAMRAIEQGLPEPKRPGEAVYPDESVRAQVIQWTEGKHLDPAPILALVERLAAGAG